MMARHFLESHVPCQWTGGDRIIMSPLFLSLKIVILSSLIRGSRCPVSSTDWVGPISVDVNSIEITLQILDTEDGLRKWNTDLFSQKSTICCIIHIQLGVQGWSWHCRVYILDILVWVLQYI
jgi:hypothetical protein